MNPTNKGSAAVSDEAGRDPERPIQGLHGVRYQSTDVQRAADFYTKYLGFTLEHQQLPAFATVSLGGFKLLLSGPGASGSRPMPDGRQQQAGGWNRIVLHVTDVAREIERLEKAGVKFRNQMETGPVVDRFSSRIPMGIRSSSSSRHGASVVGGPPSRDPTTFAPDAEMFDLSNSLVPENFRVAYRRSVSAGCSRPALRRNLRRSFGFALPARRSRNSRAVSITPTFSATATAMNWLSETPSAFANLAAAALTDVGSFSGYTLLLIVPTPSTPGVAAARADRITELRARSP